MTKNELIAKIKTLATFAYKNVKKVEKAAIEYDELTKFPELKEVIVNLLSSDYGKFIDSIDWVAPKPTTFRINLLNGQSFYLVYTHRSWIAEVEGKKYYLLNLSEEQLASQSIARILRYGKKEDAEAGAEAGAETAPEETPAEEPAAEEPAAEETPEEA
jgi:hypothetical protein